MQTSGETMQLITMQHLKHKICCENNVTLECFFSIFFLFECTHDKDIERCTKLKVDKTKDCDHTNARPGGVCFQNKNAHESTVHCKTVR